MKQVHNDKQRCTHSASYFIAPQIKRGSHFVKPITIRKPYKKNTLWGLSDEIWFCNLEIRNIRKDTVGF